MASLKYKRAKRGSKDDVPLHEHEVDPQMAMFNEKMTIWLVVYLPL
jgi:hypothetical protein